VNGHQAGRCGRVFKYSEIFGFDSTDLITPQINGNLSSIFPV
jgi:hypothetical protein